MFKCAVTGKTIGPNIGATRVILEVRPVTYEHIFVKGDKFLGNSSGWEIVKEGFTTPTEAKKLPPVEELVSNLRNQESVKRINYVHKRKKRTFVKKKDYRITTGRLTIVK